MGSFESYSKDIRDIFCRSRNDRNCILIDALNNIRTCHGTQKNLLLDVQRNIFWRRRATNFYIAILAGLTISTVFGVSWLLWTFNRTSTFGGCLINSIWPFEECAVVF